MTHGQRCSPRVSIRSREEDVPKVLVEDGGAWKRTNEDATAVLVTTPGSITARVHGLLLGMLCGMGPRRCVDIVALVRDGDGDTLLTPFIICQGMSARFPVPQAGLERERERKNAILVVLLASCGIQ